MPYMAATILEGDSARSSGATSMDEWCLGVTWCVGGAHGRCVPYYRRVVPVPNLGCSLEADVTPRRSSKHILNFTMWPPPGRKW